MIFHTALKSNCAVIESEYKSEFRPTIIAQYVALMGELCGVFEEGLGEN